MSTNHGHSVSAEREAGRVSSAEDTEPAFWQPATILSETRTSAKLQTIFMGQRHPELLSCTAARLPGRSPWLWAGQTMTLLRTRPNPDVRSVPARDLWLLDDNDRPGTVN